MFSCFSSLTINQKKFYLLSFSKLKLLKSYTHSTMKQERLNGLAIISLENDILEKIKYEDIIEDFISNKY